MFNFEKIDVIKIMFLKQEICFIKKFCNKVYIYQGGDELYCKYCVE